MVEVNGFVLPVLSAGTAILYLELDQNECALRTFPRRALLGDDEVDVAAARDDRRA